MSAPELQNKADPIDADGPKEGAPVAAPSPSSCSSTDPIEAALADALSKAAAAGAWSTVETIAAELKARRAAREREARDVIDLDVERRRRR